MKKVYYYNSYDEDIIESKNQSYKLKSGFKYLHSSLIYKAISYIMYYVVLIISFIYVRLFLGIRYKNKKILKGEKNYYLYSNHTLTLGDVLNPFMSCFNKKPYIICNSSNLGIPFIGKILPLCGALVIPNNVHDIIRFNDAIKAINKNNPIVIYPEAHLWPYSTFIRDYNNSSFHYPVDCNSKVFVSTTIFNKRKFFRRPKITIYIDGPFNIDSDKSRKENIKYLHDKVYDTMVSRASLSDYEYVVYKKKD